MLSCLKQVFGEEVYQLVSCIAQAADAFGVQAYLVGGPVRDLILRRPSIDIDIMLEGDAGLFVEFLSERWESCCGDFGSPSNTVSFPRYKTAKLQFKKAVCPGIFELDFSSARVEEYPASGAPPLVREGDLFGDLSRRDFTMNALALRLSEPTQGELIDFFNGKEDLEGKLIRIIHQNSFRDDPARLLRAVRFMVRFGFSLERETLEMFNKAVEDEYVMRLPRFRLFDEFRKALDEAMSVDVICQLLNRGLLGQILPDVSFSTQSIEFLKASNIEGMRKYFSGQLGRAVSRWQMLLVLVCRELSLDSFSNVLSGFEIKGKTAVHALALRKCWQDCDVH